MTERNRTTRRGWALLAVIGAPLLVWSVLGWPSLALAAPVASTAPTKGGGALVAFYIFGALTLFGAIMTVTRRNAVSAALFLVLTLFCTAGIYLSLHATFLAAIQVLVYAGAIMVLFIFVVMSVGKPEDQDVQLMRGWPVKALGIIAIGALVWRVAGVVGDAKLVAMPGKVAERYGAVGSMGKLLFTDYLFPFEAISILLLVAIVGAVMISRHNADDKQPEASR
ncbi:MAG: NADH-quinone oxidoreductase subunit J [Proteobacteria bacterium]|nr:MAG: NADH-quinone oxidoreductase subunit J [Pseudomonadota bacterium]